MIYLHAQARATKALLLMAAIPVMALAASCNEPDPYVTNDVKSSFQVGPAKRAAYKRLTDCEFEIAEITDKEKPDTDNDRKRRALAVNADDGSERACTAYLDRLKKEKV